MTVEIEDGDASFREHTWRHAFISKTFRTHFTGIPDSVTIVEIGNRRNRIPHGIGLKNPIHVKQSGISETDCAARLKRKTAFPELCFHCRPILLTGTRQIGMQIGIGAIVTMRPYIRRAKVRFPFFRRTFISSTVLNCGPAFRVILSPAST